MNFEFLTGFALLTLALALLAYIITGLMGFGVGDLKRVRSFWTTAFTKLAPSESKPVNQHLIGSIGKVMAHTGDSDRPMRVRINLESWPARLESSARSPVPVGIPVKVIEVKGPILVVEATEVTVIQAQGSLRS